MVAIGRALMARRGCCCSTSCHSASPRIDRAGSSPGSRGAKASSAPRCWSSSRTPGSRSSSANTRYIMENGRIVLEGLPTSCSHNAEVQDSTSGGGGDGDRRSYAEVKHYRRRKRWLHEPPPTLPAGGRGASPGVDGLTVRFGGVVALDDVSFDRRGRARCRAIIGPNGAGKTSALQLHHRHLPPDRGASARGSTRTSSGAPHTSIARAGVARTFQNLGAVRRAHRPART